MSQILVVGSFVQDLAFHTVQFPSPGESRIGTFETGPGGKGFNQAIAANRLGAKTLFIGAIGNDVFGNTVADFARNDGLQTAFQIIPDAPSGAASVVINQHAENMIVVALGANERLSSEHVLRNLAATPGAKLMLCQLESSLGATEAALVFGRKNGIVTILNPAPVNPDVTKSQLDLADILVPNETEFMFLASQLVGESNFAAVESLEEKVLHSLCRKLGNATVVLTLGPRGAFVSHAHPLPPWASRDKADFYASPAISVSPVDTTGAGDAFCGGLAAGMLQFPDQFEQAVLFANAVAGLSTQKNGTAPAMPTLSDVEHQMKDR